jgi:DNA-binding response OmpR family regulator
MQILLIEDNSADASLIRDLFSLKFEEGNMEWAASLHDGIEKLSSNKFNLIILDLGLPDSDGINTFHALRSHTRSPIVILTGHQEEGLGLVAVKAGAQDYLIKGTNADTLCRSIKFAVERHARKQLELEIRKTKIEYKEAIDSLKSCVTNLQTMLQQKT